MITLIRTLALTGLVLLLITTPARAEQQEKKDQLTESAMEAIQALGGTVDSVSPDATSPGTEVEEMVEGMTDPSSQPVPVDTETIYVEHPEEVITEEVVESVETAPVVVDTPPVKDVFLILDNSGSMKKNDPQFLASQAVHQFINNLDTETRVAIIIFDKNVKVTVPLTLVNDESRSNILGSLEQLTYKGQFTDSPAAIERAIYNLKTNGRTDAKKLIIFMTDGIVDTGNADQDLEKARWLKQDLAADAADSGIQIFGIAFTEDADFQLIQSLAQKTDGEYYRALQPEDLTGVFDEISTIINKIPEPEIIPEVIQQPVIAAPPPPAPVAPPEPIIVEVPVQTPQMNEEEQLRSKMILIALSVLIIAVLIMVMMLVRGSRKKATDEFAQEAYINDIYSHTNQPSYKLGNKPTMIGRVAGTDADHLNYIVVPESTIGRRHCLIEYKDFAYWIIDQGSINGTFVNDQIITSETRLKHGDRIRLHKYEFEFSMPEMDDAGMTQISNTVLAANPGANQESDVTVARGSNPEGHGMPEPDFDLTGGMDENPEPEESGEADDFIGEDDTVIPGMTTDDDADISEPDETLMMDDSENTSVEVEDDEDATIRPDLMGDDFEDLLDEDKDDREKDEKEDR